jgi:hypothetical protein
MRELEGEWKIERLGGLLPPMIGVRKRIHGARGETRFATLTLWPFRIERRTGFVTLVYSPPFSLLADELWPEADDSWLGRTVIAGLELGRFRMIRSKDHTDPGPRSRPKRRRSLRRRFATFFVFAAAFASVSNLSACGGEAKEDPAQEQQREVQQQVQPPEQTQPPQVEQTDRTIGEDIQG